MRIQVVEIDLYQYCKFSEFPKLIILEIFKLQIFRLFLIENFWNCRNWKITKSLKIFQFVKLKFGSINWQFQNYSSIRYFALLAIFLTLIFALWYKLISSIFISYFSASQVLQFYIWTFVNFWIQNVSHSKTLLFKIEGLRATPTRDARSIVRLFFSQIRWRKYYLKYEIAKYSFWKIWARREFPRAHFV